MSNPSEAAADAISALKWIVKQASAVKPAELQDALDKRHQLRLLQQLALLELLSESMPAVVAAAKKAVHEAFSEPPASKE